MIWSNFKDLSFKKFENSFSKLWKYVRIHRHSMTCYQCEDLLRQNELVAEMSNFGGRVISYIRFDSKRLEAKYERHLLEAHGLVR
jgi:hypothetical protein